MNISMTDAQLAQIGLVIIHWGSAERCVGSAITYTAGTGVAVSQKITAMALEQKIDLLLAVAREAEYQRLIEVAAELKRWKKLRGDERNIIAHGMASAGAAGGFITNRGKHLHVHELSLIVESAGYFNELATIAHLLAVHPRLDSGYPEPSLPPAPPSRLAEIRYGYSSAALAAPVQGPWRSDV